MAHVVPTATAPTIPNFFIRSFLSVKEWNQCNRAQLTIFECFLNMARTSSTVPVGPPPTRWRMASRKRAISLSSPKMTSVGQFSSRLGFDLAGHLMQISITAHKYLGLVGYWLIGYISSPIFEKVYAKTSQ
jgi:hypothetical protein